MGNCIINRIRGGTTYSENEQRIGTWIDGKPIYRKVIAKDSSFSGKNTPYDLSSLNIDRFFGLHGIWKTSDGTQGTIPFAFESDFVDAIYRTNGKTLNVRTTMNIVSAYLAIEYTKTTDKSWGVYLNCK